MLYRITALKAPWPEGAKVGDVIELDSVPVWAVGKCVQAPDAEAPTVEFAPPVPPEPARDLAAEVEALQQENADLRAQLAARETDEGKAAAALAEADEQAKAEKAAMEQRKGKKAT